MKNFLALLVLLMLCIAAGADAVTPKQLERIEQLKKEVVVLFKAGKFDQANQLLNEILAIDPFDKTAARYQARAASASSRVCTRSSTAARPSSSIPLPSSMSFRKARSSALNC